MKTNKKQLFGKVLSMAALILVLALVVVLAVQCGPKQPPVEPGPEGPTKTEWPEAGVYYFDAGIDEYTLTLNVGDTFALIYRGESASGSYVLEEGTLILDFNAEGKENVTASLADNVITLTYEGAAMRFLKKVNYTVSFETNGGSDIADVTVLGGKTVSKPADPTREGYIFVGWYADSEFKTPYAFDASLVTANTTVYAQWSEQTADGIEYKVNFDLNYEGAETLEATNTIGGKVFDLSNPAREGYAFGGWWISMSRNGEKLSYQYTDGMVLDANTTLYALWLADVTGTKLTAPVVHIGPASISWATVNGARSYDVKVIGPDGVAVIDETTASTTINVPFATYGAGEFEIRVTANANSGEADNSQSVRYFTNKALRTVSLFNVVGSNLVFNTVENAEKYLITVVCGNADHQHTAFDNGTSRVFNFANCDMPKEGIKFTVTAVAEGFASSTSEVFVYQRELAAVGGLHFDEESQTVHWDEVADATYYMVSVKCGNASHNHEFVNNGTKTFVSLRECAGAEGGIVVKVYPIAKGFTSPEASEYTYEKALLATPSDVVILGTTVYWTAVEGATEYEVMVGDKTYKTTTNSYDLSALLNWVEGTDYTVSVRAAGSNASLWSDTIETSYYEMGELLTYRQGTLSWNPVIGANAYEIQINDGPILTVTDANAAKIVLTREGINVIKVRFADGANRSDWVSTEVFAHAVTFDSRGGSEIVVMYKAVGDVIELPTPTKNGYSFVTWYNVPGGPASNGLAYNDVFFAESGAIVLYAHYNANKYQVNYNYSVGGSGDKTSDEVFFEQNYQLYVPVPDSATGAFGGWFSAPYGTGVQYTDAKGNSLVPWNETEGADLYAFWIDSALKFTQTKVNGKDAYAVSAGESIALVDEITIPATYKGLPVAMVSGNAFMDCTSLKVINLPKTLQQISLINPFTGCINLEAINVYDVEGETAGRYWSQDGVLFDNTTAGGAQAKIAYMPLAKTGIYRIPAGIVEIPERAFAGSAITKVIIPASVTKIGRDAFAGCAKLGAVSFEAAPAGESEKDLVIAQGAFRGCTALDKIMLPARLTEINLTKYVLSGTDVLIDSADSAFAGCTSLVSVGVMPNNKSFKSVDGVLYSADGKTLLYCPATKAGAFAIPAGTQIIAPGAFIGCDALTEVTIPNTVTYVGECAFYGLNAKLQKVTFGGNSFQDMTVGAYAFRGCTALSEIVYEQGSRVTTLGEGAFYDCVGLTTFTIPATMTRIEDAAFAGCTKLETVNFADSEKALTFGENVFYNCSSIKTITLPANVSEILGIFNGCTSLEEVNVSEDSLYFTSVEGVLFNKDLTEILFFPRGKTGEYVMPTTVVTIASGVFSGNDGLSKLVLPSTLTTIGSEAFKNSAIGEIVFEGETVGEALTIGKSAFEGASIDELTLPAHTKSIGEYAFAYSAIEEITLNEGLVTLGDYAFYQTEDLEEITIPSTLTTIGAYCFSESALEWMTFAENSVLETIGDYAFYAAEDFGDNWREAITLPKTVKTIGNYAFADAYLYCGIVFEEGSVLETIGAHAFEFTGWSAPYYFEELFIPKTVTFIGAYAFSGLKYLAEVTFEEGGTADLVLGSPYKYQYVDVNAQTVTVIERGHVFDNCSGLETVSFPARLVELGEYSFYNAGDDYYGFSVTFAEDSRLTTIGEGAFYYAALTEITIPKSVRNLDPYVDELGVSHDRLGIGAYAFYGMYSTFTTITFEEGGTEPLTIGEGAFYMCRKMTSLALPARLAPYTSYTGDVISPFYSFVLAVGINNDTSLQLTEITIEDGNQYYKAVDGVIYSADMTELIVCPAAKTGEITVPATVTKIHDRAFYQCTGITAITFADMNAAMTIGQDAFRECEGLLALAIPTNTTSIGANAFVDCEALTSLTLPKSLPLFNGAMVSGCKNLAELNIGADGKGDSYTTVDGIVFNAAMDTLIFYPVAREDTTYTVPATVKIIADSAFAGNTKLVSVFLPEGLIEIEANAFNGCTSMTSVIIPGSVALIDTNAFRNCTQLASVIFAEGTTALVMGDNVFNYDKALKTITLPARLAVMGDSVFYNASLEEVVFEANSQLTTLGDSVFMYTNIANVTLPDGVISLGDGVFFGCESLVSATLGEGLLKIGNQTFGGCTALTTVYFPASLKTMGINTFYAYSYGVVACGNLKTVVFAQGSQLESIPAGTFAYTGLEAFEVPANVKEIGDPDLTATDRDEDPGAFQGCASLQMISFADGGKCAKIGAYAFMDCAALKFVTIPVTVNTLGASAFEACAALESITVPAATTQLGERLFASCTSLENVALDTKATELPGYMFANCEKLTSIIIPASVTSIGSSCFTATGIEAFEVAEDNTAFVVVDGVLYNAEKTQIAYYPEKRSAATLTIPKEVTLIGERTFAYNTTLKEIIFEEGGTEPLVIEDEAFYRASSLLRVVLPERLTTIGEYAFYNCYQLISITIPESVKTIGDDAFYNCEKLFEVYNKSALVIEAGSWDDNSYVGYYATNVYTPTEGESLLEYHDDGFVTYTDEEGTVYLMGYVGFDTEITIPGYVDSIYGDFFYAGVVFYGSDVTKVTISEGVEYIGGAFAECDYLTEVILPESLKVLDGYAFYYCDALTKVNLPSALEELGSRVFYYCSGLSGEFVIPATVTYAGNNVFYGNSNLLLLVTPTERPSGWNSSWAGSNSVIYGFDGQDHTYTFVTNGGAAIDPITTKYAVVLPTPVKDGMYFDGWYDGEDFETANKVTGSYYSQDKTTLYAKWLTQEEYEALFNGTTMETAIQLELGETYTVNINEPGKVIYFKFTSAGEYYRFLTEGATKEAMITLYDEDGYRDGRIYASWGSNDVNKTSYMYTDGTYYIAVHLYYSDEVSDPFTFTLTLDE